MSVIAKIEKIASIAPDVPSKWPVDDFVEDMTPELYSKILRKKELEEYNLNNKASTNIFKCAKCKNRKCHITEKQTRAGDEPATTFVTCIECDHTWRFN